MTPLLGFSPDVDVTTPGVITDCVNFIPYANGMEGGPSTTTPSDVPALAAECLGAAVVTNLSGTRRVIAGTATKLYELSAGAWSDESRAAAYNAGADARWSIIQFGNSTLAANIGDAIQRSTGAGVNFADIATAPKAEIIFSVGAQVMALNVDDGASKPDGWHVCSVNDETDWTTSLTTQAASGRLVSSPGEITAGARLGHYAVAYKAKSIYIGQYVGTPSIWDWQQVPGGDIGCVGKEALCDMGTSHFFVSDDNFYIFDGTRPVPIGDEVRQWFYDNSNPSYRYRTKCVFDRQNDRVWVFYPSTSATTCDSALVFNVRNRKWGRSNRAVEAVINYVASGLTFDTWNSAGATYDSLPAVAYDSQFWLSGGQALSAFNSSHQLQLLTGDSTSSSFTTGDVGDDDAASLLTNVRLRFAPGYAPTSASVQADGKMNSGEAWTAGPSSSINDGKFDVMQEARWHRGTFSFSGPVRVTGVKANFEDAGTR
jgi:hypothetical protein